MGFWNAILPYRGLLALASGPLSNTSCSKQEHPDPQIRSCHSLAQNSALSLHVESPQGGLHAQLQPLLTWVPFLPVHFAQENNSCGSQTEPSSHLSELCRYFSTCLQCPSSSRLANKVGSSASKDAPSFAQMRVHPVTIAAFWFGFFPFLVPRRLGVLPSLCLQVLKNNSHYGNN